MTEQISREQNHHAASLRFLLPGFEVVTRVFRDLHEEMRIEETHDALSHLSASVQSQPLAASEETQAPTSNKINT